MDDNLAGTITSRDPETGRITGKTLSSEQAAELGRIKKDKSKTPKFIKDCDTLITEGGYELDKAPLAFKKVCEQIVAGGARSIQAVVEWRRWTDIRSGVGTGAKPYVCSSCRAEHLVEEVGNEGLKQLLDVLRSDTTGKRVDEAPLAVEE